jgi:hypothetical protein
MKNCVSKLNDLANKLKNLIENILYKYNYRPCKGCICFHCQDYHTCFNGCKTCKEKIHQNKCFEYKPINDKEIPNDFLFFIRYIIITIILFCIFS